MKRILIACLIFCNAIAAHAVNRKMIAIAQGAMGPLPKEMLPTKKDAKIRDEIRDDIRDAIKQASKTNVVYDRAPIAETDFSEAPQTHYKYVDAPRANYLGE
jgi:hypothetical protein